MKVRIARDGVEIGECDWEDLEQLMNEGQVLPTDHYWYEGMEDWRLLDDLIGYEESEPAAPVPEPLGFEGWESAAPSSIYRRPGIAAVVIGCTLAAAAGLALYLIFVFYDQRPTTPVPIAAPPPEVEKTYTALRARAIAELDEKFKALPRAPAPPSNAFYYGVSVKMPPAPGLLSATILGMEDVVDSQTRKTIWHTTFVLKTDYSRGQWNFKSYRASKTDMRDGVLSEVVEDENTAVPPSIVYALGLKADID